MSAAVETNSKDKRHSSPIAVRSMTEGDLAEARRIFQVAFGTFIGVPDPANFGADRDFYRPRWRGELGSGLVAEQDGRMVGSNLMTNWGSFGFFGPLAIHPELWDKGVAQTLLEPTMEQFRAWGVRHVALFTFAQSGKHVNLYQKFGFWPRFLTAIMSRAAKRGSVSWRGFSQLSDAVQKEALGACGELADSIYEGLDLSREIRAIVKLGLGETVLLWSGDRLDGFACCHCGRDTEAGEDACYAKFAAARPGPDAERNFGALLEACESLAAERGLARVDAGVNLGRERAYRVMKGRGYRTGIQGVAMHSPNEPGFCNSDDYVIDDWR